MVCKTSRENILIKITRQTESRAEKAERRVQENPCARSPTNQGKRFHPALPETSILFVLGPSMCLPTAPALSTLPRTAGHPHPPYLLPDVVVTEEAADLSPGEGPGGVRVPVTRQHVDAESFELARVQCSKRERTPISI